MINRSEARGLSGWILLAGFALVAFGLAAESHPASAQDEEGSRAVYTAPSYATADSNGRMIAVSAVDITGGSLLYLVDTESRHLSVYQATGGTKSMMNLTWVGARNIDLDLQVHGWNDKSEFSYDKLKASLDSRDGAGPQK